MTQVALHYFRYISTTCTFTKTGGGTVTIAAGWVNLPYVMAVLRSGSVTCSWSSTTNRTAFDPGISCDNATVRSMLGIASGAQTAGNASPLYTWVPEKPQFKQELCPIGVAGKKKYDSTFYTAQSGITYALGSVDIYSEIFTFSLVKKQDVFTITGSAGLSAPFIDTVYRPDECLVFELKQADDVSCAAGYVNGLNWCHSDEPESEMQTPPWDGIYLLKIGANRYAV